MRAARRLSCRGDGRHRPRVHRPRAPGGRLGPRTARRRRGRRGRRAAPGRGAGARPGVRRALRGQARRARQRRAARGDAASSPRSTSWSGAPATTRRCASPPTPPTPRNGALLQRVQERATAIETTLLFFELEWAALDDERAEELLAGDGLDFCRHHLRNVRRYRDAPAHRARGEDPRREVAHRRGRLDAAVRGADLGDRGRARRRRRPDATVAPRRRAQPPLAARPRGAAQRPPRPSPPRSRPGLRTRAFVFNTLLADKATDDRLRRYPHWLAARNLANEASDESVQALDRGGARPLRDPAALVPAEGAAARRRAARRLRPHGVGRRADEASSAVARRASSCSTATRSFSPELGDVGRTLLRRAVDRRAGAPGQARRRLLRVHGARRSSRTCCSTTPSRRRDVLTLAHELGHGVHVALAARAGHLPPDARR